MALTRRFGILLVVLAGSLCLGASMATALLAGKGGPAEAGVLSAAAPPPGSPVAALGVLETDMFYAHNALRASQGMMPLQLDPALAEAAHERAADMATRGYFAHVSPAGATAFTVLASLSYRYSLAAENLARNNYATEESVAVAMDGFMNSASHRGNILDPRLRYVGVGSATGADEIIYYAVVFAAR